MVHVRTDFIILHLIIRIKSIARSSLANSVDIMHTNLVTSSSSWLCERQIAVFTLESLLAMQLHVLSQQFPSREIISTDCAGERAFACVLWTHVVFQMSGQNESPFAYGAFVRFDIVVTLHVATQMARRHKRHATELTFIRLVFGVDSHMNGHVIRLVECFAT